MYRPAGDSMKIFQYTAIFLTPVMSEKSFLRLILPYRIRFQQRDWIPITTHLAVRSGDITVRLCATCGPIMWDEIPLLECMVILILLIMCSLTGGTVR